MTIRPMDAESSTSAPARPGTFGIVIVAAGVLLASWIGFGRFLFGVGGSLTATYALTLGVAVVVLHFFIGRGVFRAVRCGYRVRTATIGTTIAAWGCGVLLGMMIPDVTATGLQTILTRGTEPGLGLVIGLSNPLGSIMLIMSVTAVVLATIDSRGGPRVLDED
ncbi:MAG: hypothetical protein ABI400_03565 [Lacisediminihabitans sp.]